jgi:heme-degrading monooxygenase HmoA
MAFMRLSLMTPHAGREKEVSELLDKLLKLYVGRPGFLAAYRLSSDQHSGGTRLGRVSIWESEADAHRTAVDDTDIALQSQIKVLCEDETHEEHSFTASQLGG